MPILHEMERIHENRLQIKLPSGEWYDCSLEHMCDLVMLERDAQKKMQFLIDTFIKSTAEIRQESSVPITPNF